MSCTTSGQSCLALFQSKTSLDLMVVVGFIEPPNDRTVVSLDGTSYVYVVVYTWNSDSGETIFDGKVSFIDQLELRTSKPRVSFSFRIIMCSILNVAGPPPTQSPLDSTESPSLSSPQPPPPIVIIGKQVRVVYDCVPLPILHASINSRDLSLSLQSLLLL